MPSCDQMLSFLSDGRPRSQFGLFSFVRISSCLKVCVTAPPLIRVEGQPDDFLKPPQFEFISHIRVSSSSSLVFNVGFTERQTDTKIKPSKKVCFRNASYYVALLEMPSIPKTLRNPAGKAFNPTLLFQEHNQNHWLTC